MGRFPRRLTQQVVRHLPDGEPLVVGGVPIGGKLRGGEEAHLTPFRFYNPSLDQPGHGRHFRLAQELGIAVVAGAEALLFEPGDRPPSIGVEVVFELTQNTGWVRPREAAGTSWTWPRAIAVWRDGAPASLPARRREHVSDWTDS